MHTLLGKVPHSLTLAQLEKQLKRNPHAHAKSKSQLPVHVACNRDLDIKQCTAGRFRFDRPMPCRCPTHHKPPTAAKTCFRSTAFKVHRAFRSDHHRTDGCSESQQRVRRGHHHTESSDKRFTQATQTDLTTEENEGHETVGTKEQNRTKRHGQQLDKMGRELNSTDAHLKEKGHVRYMEHLQSLKYREMQATRYLSRKGGDSTSQQKQDKAQEYLDSVFREMRRLEQVTRQHTYQISHRSAAHTHQKQQTARRNDHKQQMFDIEEIQPLPDPAAHETLNEDSNNNRRRIPSISELQSQPTISNGSKQSWFKSRLHVSFGNLLDEIEGSEAIDNIAHAERAELIEGLGLIEKELNAEIVKCRTLKQVPDYITQGKTHTFLQKVLRTVEGSTRLQNHQIIDRSELLQQGIRLICNIENIIVSQASQSIEQPAPSHVAEELCRVPSKTPTPDDYDDEQGEPGHLKSQFSRTRNSVMKKLRNNLKERHRNSEEGELQSKTGQSDWELRSSVFKLKSKPNQTTKEHRVSILSKNSQPAQHNFSQSIFNRSNNTGLIKAYDTLATDQEDSKQENREEAAHDNQEISRQEKDRQEKEKLADIQIHEGPSFVSRNNKRRKGLNKMVIQDDLRVSYEKENNVEEALGLKRRNTIQLANDNDTASDEQIQKALEGARRHKLKMLAKSINDCLIEHKLGAFAIKAHDDDRTRHRKLQQLKILLNKKPELAAMGLGRNISLYYKEQNAFRVEQLQRKQRQPMDDRIVLSTMLSAVNQSHELKWTECIKTIAKADEDSDIEPDDFEKYLRQPLNSRNKEQQKLHAHIRQQQKCDKVEPIQPPREDDLGQQQLCNLMPCEDIFLWHGRNILTDPPPGLSGDATLQKLRRLVRRLRWHYPKQFQQLLQGCLQWAP